MEKEFDHEERQPLSIDELLKDLHIAEELGYGYLYGEFCYLLICQSADVHCVFSAVSGTWYSYARFIPHGKGNCILAFFYCRWPFYGICFTL